MTEFINWMNERSKIQKLLLCLPIVDILWGLYRLFGAIRDKNVVRLILAIAWILWAGYIGWIFDLVCIILTNHIAWFAE